MPEPGQTLTLALRRAQFLTLQRPQGLCLRVTRGTLWVTVDGQPEDIELGPGQRHRFDSAAAAVVGTLGGDAEFSATRAAPQGHPRLAWA